MEKACEAARPLRRPRAPGRTGVFGLGVSLVLLTAAFSPALAGAVRFAFSEEIHSHVLVVPPLVAYFFWLRTRAGSACPQGGRRGWAAPVLFAAAGLTAVAAAVLGKGSIPDSTWYSTVVLAYWLLASTTVVAWRGWRADFAFPLCLLLVFATPVPDAALASFEAVLQALSAEVAARLFELTGTPFLRDGYVFQLPGFTLNVARECSGIRSTWVLMFVASAASYLFLARPWQRAALIALALPLGVLRNATRVVVIGLLCTHYGREMIHSAIHRQGGPLFFAASLFPLVAAIWLLRRMDKRPGGGSGVGSRKHQPVEPARCGRR